MVNKIPELGQRCKISPKLVIQSQFLFTLIVMLSGVDSREEEVKLINSEVDLTFLVSAHAPLLLLLLLLLTTFYVISPIY